MDLLIVGARAVGKTHRLVEELIKDETAILLCASSTGATNARHIFKDILIRQGLSSEEADMRMRRQVPSIDPLHAGRILQGTNKRVYIDDVGDMLARLLNVAPRSIVMCAGNILVETPQGKRFEHMNDNTYLGPNLRMPGTF